MRNTEGYHDPTFAKAVAYKRRVPEPPPTVTKPVPVNNLVHFKEDAQRMRIFDVFMHYRGYHDINMGEWISLYAFNVKQAKERATSVPVKKVSDIYLVRPRK